MATKRHILLILIVLGSYSLFAQSAQQGTFTNANRNSVTLSYSPTPIFNAPFLSNRYGNFGVIHGEYGIRAVYYRFQNSGVFTLTYGRQVHEMIVLMINLSYQQIWREWDLYVDAYSPHHFT